MLPCVLWLAITLCKVTLLTITLCKAALLIHDKVRTLSALAFATSNCNYDSTAFAKRTYLRRRPYRDEYTGSLSNSEVNRRRARSVLGWGTAWEVLWVLPAFFISSVPTQVIQLRGCWLTHLCNNTISPAHSNTASIRVRIWIRSDNEDGT